ncbi:hypothetical protein PAPYR_10879 [Paratrimastix pyriformis]|uniref:RRM domain-containing protein n=1 Tax=Paratrimastix pyriformis TaxID=342808 RepID=A0ABQ8U8U7_9EUKA|nr:hypothetical protein PAPYR_10879 [Paratrimastix pyriformis]
MRRVPGSWVGISLKFDVKGTSFLGISDPGSLVKWLDLLTDPLEFWGTEQRAGLPKFLYYYLNCTLKRCLDQQLLAGFLPDSDSNIHLYLFNTGLFFKNDFTPIYGILLLSLADASSVPRWTLVGLERHAEVESWFDQRMGPALDDQPSSPPAPLPRDSPPRDHPPPRPTYEMKARLCPCPPPENLSPIPLGDICPCDVIQSLAHRARPEVFTLSSALCAYYTQHAPAPEPPLPGAAPRPVPTPADLKAQLHSRWDAALALALRRVMAHPRCLVMRYVYDELDVGPEGEVHLVMPLNMSAPQCPIANIAAALRVYCPDGQPPASDGRMMCHVPGIESPCPYRFEVCGFLTIERAYVQARVLSPIDQPWLLAALFGPPVPSPSLGPVLPAPPASPHLPLSIQAPRAPTELLVAPQPPPPHGKHPNRGKARRGSHAGGRAGDASGWVGALLTGITGTSEELRAALTDMGCDIVSVHLEDGSAQAGASLPPALAAGPSLSTAANTRTAYVLFEGPASAQRALHMISARPASGVPASWRMCLCGLPTPPPALHSVTGPAASILAPHGPFGPGGPFQAVPPGPPYSPQFGQPPPMPLYPKQPAQPGLPPQAAVAAAMAAAAAAGSHRSRLALGVPIQRCEGSLSVFVSPLPADATEEDVVRFFRTLQPEAVKVTKRSEHDAAVGFALFASEEAVSRAQSFSGQLIFSLLFYTGSPMGDEKGNVNRTTRSKAGAGCLGSAGIWFAVMLISIISQCISTYREKAKQQALSSSMKHTPMDNAGVGSGIGGGGRPEYNSI